MIAVAKDEVGEVALKPLVEVVCVVVLRLRAVPHVESLVHDDEAHRVAHGEQLRSRRVVGTANAVASHVLQDLELAMESVFVDGSTEAS